MRILTFNLNGIRSAQRKGFFEWLAAQSDIDACLFQEIKASAADLPPLEAALRSMGFAHVQWHCAEKKGYSGTGLCSRELPDAHAQGFGAAEFDGEGRLCHASYGGLELASAYFPSGSAGPERQASKMRFLAAFPAWTDAVLARGASAIVGADLNIAHANLDLKNWKGNIEAPGCTAAERQWLTDWLAKGWADCARDLRPSDPFYTWWSQRAGSRERDVGWRIDAQIATAALGARALEATVLKDPVHSDHAPLIVDYEGSFASWSARPMP